MRRYVKKRILSLLSTMTAAHGAIKTQAGSGNTEAVLSLLEDCQECAIEIGTQIEKSEGEGTRAVRPLEAYCELVYQFGQSIHEGADLAGRVDDLDRLLLETRGLVADEVPDDKWEVVFLPYKASMWDSLESIWLAARDDENCNVYVVPIPYYDKKPDGSFGKMWDESGEYPEDVPVTDWREFGIPENRPDVIFIHNPYDDGNFVTSVHPNYYAKELKKYTDMLVYVPYFVMAGEIPPNLCVNAGTLYADRVIVQSEAAKGDYIREIRRYEAENGCEGCFGDLDKKFLALGSPKFDKVRRTKLEDCSVPEEWERLIRQPDGGRKKVIFYNTSVNMLLIEKENMLKKIEAVLSVFQERSSEVTLLWRPHPLSEASIDAVRPELFEAYRGLVERYRREGWGIYDESADLHRAIAVADAYFGDWSSIIALFGAAGKPCMVENFQIREYLD